MDRALSYPLCIAGANYVGGLDSRLVGAVPRSIVDVSLLTVVIPPSRDLWLAFANDHDVVVVFIVSGDVFVCWANADLQD